MSSRPEGPAFRYGLRIGVALLPNLLLTAEIGGKVAMALLLVSSWNKKSAAQIQHSGAPVHDVESIVASACAACCIPDHILDGPRHRRLSAEDL